jgi:hypothetical protein
MKVTLKDIQTVALFSGKKDVRYYINGIHFDGKNGVIVATNGHGLTIANVTSYQDGALSDDAFTLGNDAIKAMIATKQFSFDVTLDGDIVKVETYGQAFTFSKVDGKYPDYQRVVPSNAESTKMLPLIDANYMMIVEKQAKLQIGDGGLFKIQDIKQNLNRPHDSAIIFEINERVKTVVMPMALYNWKKGAY